MEYKVLNNGLKMPMVGLGVYNISEGETQRVVEDAISVGYRSIDTAAMYYNEKGVGDAVRACGVSREELFITTKICDSCYTNEETLRTVDHSMKRLGLEKTQKTSLKEIAKAQEFRRLYFANKKK